VGIHPFRADADDHALLARVAREWLAPIPEREPVDVLARA